jgi:Spy/CpxP family protein refolding chaperone
VTVASLAARSNARQPLVWLLTVSLVLNLFFVAAFLWSRLRDYPPRIDAAERLEWIGVQLRLDPKQKEAFVHYSQAVHANMQAMHEAVDPLMGKAWSEVAKPDADVSKVVQLFDEAGLTRRGYMHELAPVTLSFLTTLSPEQRAKFVELARQRPWAKRHQEGAP